MLYALPFPNIDPIAIELGPIAIRWYSLAYIAGLVLGWRYIVRLAGLPPKTMPRKDVDDLLVWIALAVILGGRLGYVLFYKPAYYLQHPLEALQLWHGGMSFHGGLIAVVVAGLVFCRLRKLNPWKVGDLLCCAGPIGLLLGRVANFVNGELYGRVTGSPLGMVFPGGGPLPRHPSQLYEAFLEGVVLFVVMAILVRREGVRRKPGVLTGIFFAGYGTARTVVEFFREPDAHLGYIAGQITMGQILSLPMILIGAAIAVHAWRRPAAEA